MRCYTLRMPVILKCIFFADINILSYVVIREKSVYISSIYYITSFKWRGITNTSKINSDVLTFYNFGDGLF